MTDSVTPASNAGGVKHDQSKLPHHLLPLDAIDEVTAILQFGATKYDPRNWEKGMAWSRLFSAALRHLFAWWMKRGTDPDTGRSHLAHAMCCVMFLLTYELRGVGTDDRP